jgi:putative flippase GtrA
VTVTARRGGTALYTRRVPFPRGLQDRLRINGRLLLKELSAFGVVGAVCFVIQVGSFQLLYAQLGVGAVTSNLVATLVSMTVAYFAHRYWSFSHRARSGLAREYTLFAAINGATLLLGLGVVALVRYPLDQDGALVLQLANVGSIVLGTAIRYLSYRRWVFRAHDVGAAPGGTDGDDAVQDGRGSAGEDTAVAPVGR